jgi:hypothetical protein
LRCIHCIRVDAAECEKPKKHFHSFSKMLTFFRVNYPCHATLIWILIYSLSFSLEWEIFSSRSVIVKILRIFCPPDTTLLFYYIPNLFSSRYFYIFFIFKSSSVHINLFRDFSPVSLAHTMSIELSCGTERKCIIIKSKLI